MTRLYARGFAPAYDSVCGVPVFASRHTWFRPNASLPFTWEDGPGLLRAAGAVVALARVEAEEYNLPSEKIFLGGFDQVSHVAE